MSRAVAFMLFGFVAVLRATAGDRMPGADVLLSDSLHLLRDRRVGLITNQSALLSDGSHLLEGLLRRGVRVTALFAPEHGFGVERSAGERIAEERDSGTALTVHSLYGVTVKPTHEMLAGVDILLFDLQDVGARFYTYLSTLYHCMQAAAEERIPLVILDRPNPLTGEKLEGPLLRMEYASFVGVVPIPIRHGMTLGELACMINGESWLGEGLRCDLRVIPCSGWRRRMWFDETGLAWKAPSPNMQSLATAIVYPGCCLVEGSNLSEGRGTDRPFEWIGAPFIEGEPLAAILNGQGLPGVHFHAIEFTPRSIPGKAPIPRHEGRRCGGVEVRVTDRQSYRPVETAVRIMAAAMRLAPGEMVLTDHLDRLYGGRELRRLLTGSGNPDTLFASWRRELRSFSLVREKYLLYN